MLRGRSGRRTDYSWTNFGDVATGAAINAGGIFGGTGSVVATPQTLTRVRGKVGVVLDTVAANESIIFLCGLMVASSDGFVAGAAPEIFTNAGDEASWIWQGALFVDSGAEAAVITDNLSASIDVDSKAMRKLKPGQTIAFVHEAPLELAVDQGGTYDVSFFFHCLIGD